MVLHKFFKICSNSLGTHAGQLGGSAQAPVALRHCTPCQLPSTVESGRSPSPAQRNPRYSSKGVIPSIGSDHVGASSASLRWAGIRLMRSLFMQDVAATYIICFRDNHWMLDVLTGMWPLTLIWKLIFEFTLTLFQGWWIPSSFCGTGDFLDSCTVGIGIPRVTLIPMFNQRKREKRKD